MATITAPGWRQKAEEVKVNVDDSEVILSRQFFKTCSLRELTRHTATAKEITNGQGSGDSNTVVGDDNHNTVE